MSARLLALLFALSLTSAAEAQIIWSTTGTGCVPSDATTKFDRSKDGIASVQHATGNVDLIVLTCPIPQFDKVSADWGLLLTYQDSTGTAPAAFVRARLYRLPIGTATPILVNTASSNSSPVKVLNNVDTIFPHTFNFGTNIYWVRVELERALTNQTVIFHSVALGAVVVLSDFRAKHDVLLLGHLDNGLGFYRFRYHGSDAAYVGVMAQEVEAIMPDAVVRGDDGYLRVYYDRLGLRMQTWEDWLATGEKIPPTASSMQQ
jgi:hypothetical protein